MILQMPASEYVKMDEGSNDKVVGEGWRGEFKKLLVMSNFLLGISTVSLSYLKSNISVFPLTSITNLNMDWMVISAGLYLVLFSLLLCSKKLDSNSAYYLANFAIILGCSLVDSLIQDAPQTNMMPCKILDTMSSKLSTLPTNISKQELGTVCDWEKLFTQQFHTNTLFTNLSISSHEFGAMFESTKFFLHEVLQVNIHAKPCMAPVSYSDSSLSKICDWIHSKFAVIQLYQGRIAILIIILNVIVSIFSLFEDSKFQPPASRFSRLALSIFIITLQILLLVSLIYFILFLYQF